MLELIAHLLGDYCLQSHVMASRKTSSWRWALLHAAIYTLPFLLLTRSPAALLVIGGTHAVIDRYRLAAAWCRWYGVGHPGLWHRSETFEAPPAFLLVWLVIIVDNTAHLLINHVALALLG